MPLSSLLDSAVDSTNVLQHLWIFLSFHHLCLICPSHRFPFQENLNVLDSVAVAICQGSPSSPYPWDHLCLLELATLDQAWVQRTLLLLRREQLLLSTSGTSNPIVTVGVDSVTRLLQEEALPTMPS